MLKTLNCSEIDYDIVDDNLKLKLPVVLSDEELPTVSIVIPTYNRSQFASLIMRNWDQIDYPKTKMELSAAP